MTSPHEGALSRQAPLSGALSPLQEGDVLLGKYRIQRVLGQGGMGVVYAAQHLMLDQPVAIKLLARHALMNQEALGRFLNEARNAARIDSEYVCRVMDLGVLPQGGPYIAMELLLGWDLGRLLAARGPLPVVEAVGYVIQALTGIGGAHVMGVIHRDLKPSNLFLARKPDGRSIVKVLDFGISKAAGTASLGPPSARGRSLATAVRDRPAALTSIDSIVGSPAYMSPEQAKGVDVDGRADLWAVGIILHELLTGRVPFAARSVGDVIIAILSKDPPPVTALRADLPPGLAAVITRCLAKDPACRYASAADLAVALAPFGPWRQAGARIGSMPDAGPGWSLQGSAGPGAPGAMPAPGAAVRTASAWSQRAPGDAARAGRAGRAGARERLLIVLGAALGTSAVATGVLFLAPGRSAKAVAPPPPAVSATTAPSASAAPAESASAAPPPPAPPAEPSATASPAPPDSVTATTASPKPPRPVHRPSLSRQRQ